MTSATFHVKVLPALLTATQDPDVEVSDSASLALGRCIARDEANLALVPLTRQLSHAEASSREAAVLAMGMVASPAAIPTLHALLCDTEIGRRLTNRPAGVEERVRAVAAVSLGLIGEKSCATELLDGFNRPTASYEIQQACVCALGLLHEADEGLVARLLAILDDRTLPPFVRCHVPGALGHLVTGESGGPARAALPRLAASLRDEGVDYRIRQGIPPALARMAALEDTELVQLLIADAKDDSDFVTRAASLIALGDIAAADRDPAAHAKADDTVTTFLLATMQHPSRISLRSFAALALGIAAGNEARPPSERERIDTLLRAQLAAAADPQTRGAIAVALGLAGAMQALPDLDQQWTQARDPVLRGALATAYGLLGSEEAADRLHEELFRSGVTMNETLDLAHALALIARPDSSGMLIGHLQQAKSVAEVGPAALALGFVGNAAAVDPLLSLLFDPSAPAAKRAVVVESLGLLIERDRISWHARCSIGSNYTQFGPTMNRLVGLL